MSEVLFQSPRRFQIWRYNVSHRQLLLRSTKAIGVSTRVDVLFKDVAGLNLHTDIPGLTVRSAGSDDVDFVDPQLRSLVSEGRVLFEIESSTFSGYVVARLTEHAEDSVEYDEPSHLFSSL